MCAFALKKSAIRPKMSASHRLSGEYLVLRSFPSSVLPAHLRRQALAATTLSALLALAACGGGDGDSAAGVSSAGGVTDVANGTTDDGRLFRDGPDEIPEPNAGIDFEAEQRAAGGLPVAAVEGDVADSVVARKALPAAPLAATQGAWGPQVKWPFIPIHAVVMPDGRVMTYGSLSNGQQGGKLVRSHTDRWRRSQYFALAYCAYDVIWIKQHFRQLEKGLVRGLQTVGTPIGRRGR